MTAAEFKRKWGRSKAKETASYQEHFTDLCRLLGQPTPIEADPSGSDFFCYQKRVVKDEELFALHETSGEETESSERGFADVWKKGCFAWEYKGKKKNLEEAYKQLLRYRESLLNPPLLVVCDFDRYIVRTNFNGTVQEQHEFTNDQIDRPEYWRILRALFENPEFLRPQRTTAQVTENLAETIAEVARSLQKREAEELTDAKTRKEMNFAQRQNLRIARFLNRIVFCFFAEDTGLLPRHLFSELLKTGLDDLKHFARTLENLFAVMATGGHFGKDKIRHFNGHLFEESSVFELTEEELKKLADAGEADWQFIEPSIMGTLFERALEPEQRSQLGAHYTSEADIETLVEPVLMAPLRREWAMLKGELAAAYVKGQGTRAQRDKLAMFQKRMTALSVLDPACGSGNFLYVSLQLLLDLEKEVVTFATQLGFKLAPQVSVQQLRAIEINPYAFELAQVSVQIGFLQWRRDNGFDNDRSPVLQNLDGFQNEDALLVPHFRSKAKTLKEAQAGEHKGDDALRFYTERDWPKCDVVVSNPPFLGGSKLWEELGRHYQKELWRVYEHRVPGAADLCCYWFEKARQHIESAKCKRAGLLATQGIRGGANREVLKRIKTSGDIFYGVSDRDWILDGASVHVSMIGFDDVCDTVWEQGHLEKKIAAKLVHLEKIAGKRKEIEGEIELLTQSLNETRLALLAIHRYGAMARPAADTVALKQHASDLEICRQNLDSFLPIDDAISSLNFITSIPAEVTREINGIAMIVKSIPEPTKQEAARDYLVSCQERLEAYQDISRRFVQATGEFVLSRKVYDVYAEVSTRVLDGIYKQVESEFTELYKFVNRDDEGGFDARLIPSIGKLGFDVDFYGRGYFPPGAYHSEGHQDGMGLCLYLALMKHLLGNGFTFAVLDDVLMSVDSGHRREVCKLLKEKFPDTQFILTTHDQIWLRHMKSAGLISSGSFISFRRWNVDQGPTEWEDRDVWTEINSLAESNNILGAASVLRNYLEYISAEICHALRARVEFRGDAQFQLGDLLPNAIGQFGKLLRQAKAAAQSWGHKDVLDSIEVGEKKFAAAVAKSKVEEWQINPAIHYNEWANFQKEDFLPVVASLRHLIEFLRCEKCADLFYVLPERGTSESVRCRCGLLNLNLVSK